MSENVRKQLQQNANGLNGSKKRLQRSKKLKKQVSVQRAPKKQVEETVAISVEPVDPYQGRKVIFEPNIGPQTDFLAAGEREVLYGGSAGGGKSYAMLADPLRYITHPQFSGLLVRHTTEELR